MIKEIGTLKKTVSRSSPVYSASVENKFERMIRQLHSLRKDLKDCWSRVEHKCRDFDPQAWESSRNLVHYVALRRHDIRKLQKDLARHGFSSLGRSESFVMTNINKVLKTLYQILRRRYKHSSEGVGEINLDEAKLILKSRTDALLGREPIHRKVRIMVTLPSEAADDEKFVLKLIKNGMNCARINCAHDGPEQWSKMVKNIRSAEKVLGRDCRICFDVSGPKLRTGHIEEGPRVLKIRPIRDRFGKIIQPAQVRLVDDEEPVSGSSVLAPQIRLPKEFLKRLTTGDKIRFRDTRHSRRTMVVKGVRKTHVLAECYKTAYISPETELKFIHHKKWFTARAACISPLEQFILLEKGDSLILTKATEPGRIARFDENGKLTEPARIPCTLNEVFNDAKPGEKIWFDDGKIAGVIKSVEPDQILVSIKYTGARPQKLRSDKGINLPETDLHIPSLTDKDLADLEFIVEHSDLVGYSFVRSASDVIELQRKLDELNGSGLGIILKIETRKGFENLPEILMTAMSSASAGVMIARGDLAIETGFERLAEVQEEILWMCEAAHIPVIWATQVLEGLNKTGVFSRAEITDAAMSERSECVMLNKGQFVVETVRTLNNILVRMQSHQDKKRSLLRRLHLSERFFRSYKKKDEQPKDAS